MIADMQHWIGSLIAYIQRWISPMMNKITRSLEKTSVTHLAGAWFHKLIPLVGILSGGAAFGFWWNSISAGLFACFALFFLAGIYEAIGQVVAAVLKWQRAPLVAANLNCGTSAVAEASDVEITAQARAVECLQPWVADETSLTEENAKAYCAVLLEMVAALQPKLARKQPA